MSSGQGETRERGQSMAEGDRTSGGSKVVREQKGIWQRLAAAPDWLAPAPKKPESQRVLSANQCERPVQVLEKIDLIRIECDRRKEERRQPGLTDESVDRLPALRRVGKACLKNGIKRGACIANGDSELRWRILHIAGSSQVPSGKSCAMIECHRVR